MMGLVPPKIQWALAAEAARAETMRDARSVEEKVILIQLLIVLENDNRLGERV